MDEELFKVERVRVRTGGGYDVARFLDSNFGYYGCFIYNKYNKFWISISDDKFTFVTQEDMFNSLSKEHKLVFVFNLDKLEHIRDYYGMFS